MKDRNLVSVLIPLYTNKISVYERISLQQAIKVFARYDIILVVPETLHLDVEFNVDRIERFADDFFESISSYNRLVMSAIFYERFLDYKYILIYQLDAFVFADKLEYFCGLNYDYIGAPWLHGMIHYISDKKCIWYVGNGGFSLRNVCSFLKVINKRQSEIIACRINEDIFFSSLDDKNFNIAPIEVALQFAFEREVRKCFEENNGNLPFGCHAWTRYDFQFWRPYIEQCGYTFNRDLSELGVEDILKKNQYEQMKQLSDFWTKDYNRKKIRQNLLNFMKNSRRRYVVFGAGSYGEAISKWLKDIDMPIAFFCDNNVNLLKSTLNGYSIVSVEKLVKYRGEIYIIISALNYSDEIVQQLLELGFEVHKDFIKFVDLIQIIK